MIGDVDDLTRIRGIAFPRVPAIRRVMVTCSSRVMLEQSMLVPLVQRPRRQRSAATLASNFGTLTLTTNSCHWTMKFTAETLALPCFASQRTSSNIPRVRNARLRRLDGASHPCSEKALGKLGLEPGGRLARLGESPGLRERLHAQRFALFTHRALRCSTSMGVECGKRRLRILPGDRTPRALKKRSLRS